MLHSVIHTAPPTHTRAVVSLACYAPFRSHSLQGQIYFPALFSCGYARKRSASYTFPASPPHISALSVHSRSLRFTALSTPALVFSNPPVQAKKCDQPCCKQLPATAICASRVRGTRSTRSGSPTTHKLHCSFASLISNSALLPNSRSRLFHLFRFQYFTLPSRNSFKICFLGINKLLCFI